eukprot:3968707-Pyramimonas_sp.AAC.1
MATSRSRWGNLASHTVGASSRAAGARDQAVGTTPLASSGARPRPGRRQREVKLCGELLGLSPGARRSF